MTFLKVGLRNIDSEGFTLPTQYWKGIMATDDYVDMDADKNWNLYSALFKVLRQDYIDRNSKLGSMFDFELGDYYDNSHDMIVVEGEIKPGNKQYDECKTLYAEFDKIEKSQENEKSDHEFGLYDELKLLHDATNWNNINSVRAYNERARELREEYADRADIVNDVNNDKNQIKNMNKSDRYNEYLDIFGENTKFTAEEYQEFYEDSMIDALYDYGDDLRTKSGAVWNVFKGISEKNIFDRAVDNFKTVRIFGDKGPINMIIDKKFIKEAGINSQGNRKFDVALPEEIGNIVVESRDGHRRKQVGVEELLNKHNESLAEVSRWHENNTKELEFEVEEKDLDGINK